MLFSGLNFKPSVRAFKAFDKRPDCTKCRKFTRNLEFLRKLSKLSLFGLSKSVIPISAATSLTAVMTMSVGPSNREKPLPEAMDSTS
ncbi:MAG: hypothetical protein DDT25_00936 [Chloroflexi bacterium]|nr:hypothetical protein [Chloroflexota bacterium]